MAKTELKFWVFVADYGPGRAVPFYFRTKAEAKAYARQYEKVHEIRLCDDIQEASINLDAQGKVISARWSN